MSFRLHAHLAFCTKYRRCVLNGVHIRYLTQLYANACGDFGATLMERNGGTRRVHLPTQYPPKVPVTTLAGATDHGLLIGLGLLAFTGMLTLLLRATPAYGLVLVAHLATIVVCFAVLPYTRFVHAVYRFLAIVADNIERRPPG